MGGGGFMENANSTNLSHRNQKQQRRKKFKNDQSEKVGTREDVDLHFIDSNSDSAKKFRSQLQARLKSKKRSQLILAVVFLLILVSGLLFVLNYIGFI